MMRCALVGAVDFNAEHFIAQQFDCVIAADRGYESLRAIGRFPDIAVGDFDSLGYVPSDVETLVVPCEKDESDIELAIHTARSRSADEVVFYGVLSQRLDHTLANIALMVGCARAGLRVFGIGDSFALAPLNGRAHRVVSFDAFDPAVLDHGPYGRFLSAFAFGGMARGVCEDGLKYALDDADVRDDASLGLSNEFTGAPCALSVGEGDLVVTFPLDAWDHLRPQ